MGIEKVCHGMRGVERWVEYKYYTTVQVIKWYIDDSMIQIWAKMKGKAYKKTDAESMAKQKVLSNVVDTLSDILEIDSEDKVQLSVSGYQQIQIWGPSTLSQFLFGVLKPEYHDEEDLEALTNFQNLKLPSHRPSIVCENCLYSQEKDRRARAFHIMDPKGILEMLLMFLEDRGDGVLFHPSLESNSDSTNRILPFLGTRSDDLVTLDGGYEMTLLPGGMYMGCPSIVSKSVAESKPFHLKFT
ncbi:hypothetical protein D5086_030674 [Populus alba]|uniref:Uncharacterized protein n=1 Tax=Populus alba TaxID=43335 RepID=A0ACC4AQI2_POPAL